MPVEIIHLAHIELALMAIDCSGDMPRKQREQLCIDRLVNILYGADATKSNQPNGAPVITINGAEAQPCSISHCRTHAIIAKTTAVSPIGVDIETYRDQLHRTASRFLGKDEMDFYGIDDTRLLAAWTMKEAVYKAAGISPLPLTDIKLPAPSTFGTGEARCHARGQSFNVIYCDYLPGPDNVFMTLVERI